MLGPMNSLFKRKKTPEQLVKLLEEALRQHQLSPAVILATNAAAAAAKRKASTDLFAIVANDLPLSPLTIPHRSSESSSVGGPSQTNPPNVAGEATATPTPPPVPAVGAMPSATPVNASPSFGVVSGGVQQQQIQQVQQVQQPQQLHGSVEVTSTAMEEIAKRLNQIKLMLYGETNEESNPLKCAQLADHLIKSNLIIQLITVLSTLSFEARKHVAQVYNNLMRRDLGKFVAYIQSHAQVLVALIDAYSSPDIALNCGTMLRESIRHEALAREIMHSNEFWNFFDIYVHLPNFDVASDAFASFKDLLTRHKTLSADFFAQHFDIVFLKYNSLLTSTNYVTRRQSLKLLGEILLDRANFTTMMRYIGKRENLKLLMNLLRDKSANIQFEAFHVFKVFVANPKKPDDITEILVNNKEKLIQYLKNFQNEKEDEQFREEKSLLIKTLENLSLTSTSTLPTDATPSTTSIPNTAGAEASEARK